jgi:hypothetical protein
VGCSVNGDVIVLAASGSQPYPGVGAISDNVVIKAASGANARSVTIDAGQGELSVNPGASVTLAGVSLNCVTNCAGTPTVTNQGALTLSADAVTGNTGLAAAPILDTTPANSTSSASLTVLGSTISANAGHVAGAIDANPGSGATGAVSLKIANSTIADNVSLTDGGGVTVTAATAGSSTAITNTTITGNSASGGGGIYVSAPTTLSNTIIAANSGRTNPDCLVSTSGANPLADGPGGHNLIGDGTGCIGLTPGTNNDHIGTGATPLDPQLGPLAFNGGATESQPLLASSSAIGAGSAASCETQPIFNLDQRGQRRNAPTRDTCDVGADDTGGSVPAGSPPAITSAASAQATVSGPLAFKVLAKGTPTAALSESGTLPAGVRFTDGGAGTATLAGTPAAGSAGRYPITITARNGVGSAAVQSFTLTVTALSVTSVAPATIDQGASGLAVKIAGTGFQTRPAVSASDPGITLSSVSVRSLGLITGQASVNPAVAPGSYDLNVTQGGVSTTCSGCLTVAPAPAVSGVSPTSFAQGATSVPVTISGNGLPNPAKVSVTGPGTGVTAAVSSASSTSVSVRVTVPANAATGAYSLSVTGAAGAIATCVGCLSVGPGPAITTITPAGVSRGEKTAFTVTGAGFTSDAKLTGPKGVTFTKVSVSSDGATISATMTVAATALPGSTLPITVKDGPLGGYGGVSDPALTIT